MTGNKVLVRVVPAPAPAPAPVASWHFLTKHARVLLSVAANPESRLCDIAVSVELTERRVQGILTDLISSGYVIRAKSGRRNRYEVRSQLPIPDFVDRVRAIGDFVSLFADEGGVASPRSLSGLRDLESSPLE